MNLKRLVFAAFVVLGGLAWGSLASANGDLWNRWTDHLRHMAEALALTDRGFGIYLGPFGRVVGEVGLCAEHQGLWADVGVPYPPLGVLFHWPLAALERSGLASPAFAHRAMVFTCAVAGVVATIVGAHGLGGARRALFVSLAGPLLVGAGLSGFFDPLYAIAAFSAVRSRHPLAGALAFSLHFRGVVALASVGASRAVGPLRGFLSSLTSP